MGSEKKPGQKQEGRSSLVVAGEVMRSGQIWKYFEEKVSRIK